MTLFTIDYADPTIAQHWVTGSCLVSRWMWASVTDGGPTLTQLCFKASWGTGMLVPPAWSTDRAEWILASTGDAGPKFNRHWVGVGLCEALNQCWFGQRRRQWSSIGSMSCLLGVLTSHILFRMHIGMAPKGNNKFCLIHSLYCPQEPFNIVHYKSHRHYIY